MRAKTHFQSTRLGNISEGDRVPDDEYGQHLKELGLVEDEPTYETKVVRQKPVTRKKTSKRKSRVDNKADD